jgi:pimeloyl-ACP methyl ester carboxylesterase
MLVEEHGAGPRVVLVHGALTNGPATWAKQLPLAERWRLLVLTRPGFAPNPPIARCDFDADAAAVADLLDEPAHLVGHSYGALVALLAAVQRPEHVRSLTLVEAPVFGLVRGNALVEHAIAVHLAAVEEFGDDPRAFMVSFTERLGGQGANVPDPLPDPLRQGVELLIHERSPWEADIPVAALAAAPFRTLVVSGGHDPVQELMSDALAEQLGSRAERAVITGRGHNVQRVGDQFNDRLEAFFSADPTH